MNKTTAIMLHLKEKGSITSWEAIKEYGATRLSAIIYNLRHKYNLDIRSEEIEFTDRFGSKASYVKYIYKNNTSYDNYVILKWGSLKAFNFSNDFIKKHDYLVGQFENIWDRIYKNTCSAIGGSDKVQKDNKLQKDMLKVIRKLYACGVRFENGFEDTIYNSWQEIENYILDYGKEE